MTDDPLIFRLIICTCLSALLGLSVAAGVFQISNNADLTAYSGCATFTWGVLNFLTHIQED